MLEFYKYKRARSSCWIGIFLCALIVTGSAQIEVTLSPNVNLDFDTDCLEIEIGDRVVFTRDAACGPHLLISPDRGRTSLFVSPKVVVPFIFEEPGEYTIFCNGTSDSALAALCINVIDPSLLDLNSNPIPTVGEWGIICLLLLLMICGVVAVQSKQYDLMIHQERTVGNL